MVFSRHTESRYQIKYPRYEFKWHKLYFLPIQEVGVRTQMNVSRIIGIN